MKRHSSRIAWALPAVLIALVVGGLLVWGKDGGGESTPSQSTPANPWARLRRMAADAGERPGNAWPFSALSGAGVAMPPSLRQTARETLGLGHRQLNLQFERARYARTALGFGIWIVRGEGVTCMFHGTATTVACNVNAGIPRYGMKTVAGDDPTPPPPGVLPDSFIAFGIAPDWARAVRVKIVGGPSKTIPVENNTYALRAPAPIGIKRLIAE